MYCKNCGKKMADGAIFCPECGTKNVFEQKELQPQKSTQTRNVLLLGILIFAVIIILVGGLIVFLGNRGESVNKDTQIDGNNERSGLIKDTAHQYVELHYGFADSTMYAKNIVSEENIDGSISTTEKDILDGGLDGKAIYYKEIESGNHDNGLVCAYFSDHRDERINLEFTYLYNYRELSSGSHTVVVSDLTTNDRCYIMVKDDYLAYMEMSEKVDAVDGDTVYKEEITVYRMMDNELDDMYVISRELQTGTNELKRFEIDTDTEWIFYVSGYGRFTAEGAEFVSTQQEFCDRANNLLKECSMDCIVLDKTSWNNRWFGTNIDESNIPEDMVKIDFLLSEPTTNEKDEEITDIVIKINDEKQQLAEGEILEEVEDDSVTYEDDTTPMQQQPTVMPDNIPQSVDANGLEDLMYFNIDGFWYSSDYKYVYHIFTQHPDNGFGTLYFADLEGSSKAKHGQVKQTSSYSVILKAMEDDGFSPEVYASNSQLVSDEITLIKTDDWITNSLMGVWSNGDKTYTFESDGNYEVKTSDDWYWGKYFIMGDNNIVLGENLEDLSIYDFSLEGNTLTINGNSYYR